MNKQEWKMSFFGTPGKRGGKEQPTYRIRVGSQFGKLTVLESDWGVNALSRARCTCGEERWVKNGKLVAGAVIQCKKCKGRAISRSRLASSGQESIVADASVRKRLRQIRAGMLERCYNSEHQDYANYGARGIAVCDRWRESFDNFLEDIRTVPHFDDFDRQIDRRDNSKGYFLDNVSFVICKHNIRNRRTTGFVEHKSVKIPLAEFHERYCPRWTIKNIWYHVRKGRTTEQMLALYEMSSGADSSRFGRAAKKKLLDRLAK